MAVPVLVLSGTVASPALADTWSPPPGAVDLLLFGSSTSSNLDSARELDPSPTQANGLTTVPALSIGHLPGRGTFALSSSPTAGQVYADPLGTCRSPGYQITGTMVVDEVSYNEDGSLRQIAAEVTRSCGGGTPSTIVWRWHSTLPYGRLGITAPADAVADVGDTPWVGDWTVRNTGTAAVTISDLASSQDSQRDGSCTAGLQLDVGQTCTVTLHDDTLLAHVGYSGPVAAVAGAGVPAVSASASLTLGKGLVPPTFRVGGRTTTDLELFWSQGSSPQDDPVVAYELVLAVGGVQKVVPLASPDARDWPGSPLQDLGVPVGSATPFWAVRLVTASGRRSMLSTSVAASVGTYAYVGVSRGAVIGGASAADPTGVTLVGPQELPTGASAVGAAVAPDRAHLVVTLLDQGRGALWVTDVRGRGGKFVDTSMLPAVPFHGAVLSPDGTRAALTTETGTIVVVDLTATPAQPTTLASTGAVQAWSPDGGRLLVLGGTLPGGQVAPAGLRWVGMSTETSTPVAGTASATAAAVSRSGSIVWRQPASAGGSDLLQYLALGSTTPQRIWTPDGCALGAPAFDPTGSNVYLSAGGSSCSASPGGIARTIYVYPSSPSNAYVGAGLSYALDGPVSFVRTIATAPTLTLEARDASPNDGLTPVTRTTVTMHPVVSDADDPVGALHGTCVVDNKAAAPCPLTDVTSPVLAQGTHTLTMTVADPAGHTSPPATVTWTVDTTAPTAWMTGIPPVYAQSVGWDWVSLPGQVTWAGSDAGGAGGLTFQTRYRYAFPTSPWSGQLALYTGTETSTYFGFQQGYSYCLSVRATDAAGNVGPWSAERCTTAVLDDNFVWAGVSRALPLHSKAYAYGDIAPLYNGEYRQSQNVSARRIGVVMTTCPTCGSFEVWQGKVRLGVVSGYSASKTYRTVRWLPASSTYRWGQVMVKAVSNGKVAYFDGLVIGK